MKYILFPVLLCASIMATAQNSMLKDPVKGAVPTAELRRIGMVSNGDNVVMIVSDATSLYAVDIEDSNPANAAANAITSVPNFVADKLKPLAGQDLYVMDMAVNPMSRSVYILAKGGTDFYIFKVEDNGAKVTLVDLSNVNHSKISWGGDLAVNAMTYHYESKTLYVSSGSFSLDGELAWLTPPFANNSTVTKRSTTLFKSNWGGTYTTTAPLETLAIGDVDGKPRLMGVTTCAPGFSIDASKIAGTTLLTVTEDFNIHYGFSSKVVYMHHDGKDWLYDLHDNNIYRIGKKYLDGSAVAANKYDNNAVQLRDNSGKILSTVPADDLKLMSTSSIAMMALWDHYRLVVLESGATGALKMSQMSTETAPPAGINNITAQKMSVYPNPANDEIVMALPGNTSTATLNLISMTGSIVMAKAVKGEKVTVDVSGIAPGLYTLTASLANGSQVSTKLTIE